MSDFAIIENCPLNNDQYSSWPNFQLQVNKGLADQAQEALGQMELPGSLKGWLFNGQLQVIGDDLSLEQILQVAADLWEKLNPPNGDIKLLSRVPETQELPADLADLPTEEYEGETYEVITFVLGHGFVPKFSIIEILFPVTSRDVDDVRYRVKRFRNGVEPELTGQPKVVQTMAEAVGIAYSQKGGHLDQTATNGLRQVKSFVFRVIADLWSDEYVAVEGFTERRIPRHPTDPTTPKSVDHNGESWYEAHRILGIGSGPKFTRCRILFAKKDPMNRLKIVATIVDNNPEQQKEVKSGEFDDVQDVIRFAFNQPCGEIRGAAWGANRGLREEIKRLRAKWFEAKERKNPFRQ